MNPTASPTKNTPHIKVKNYCAALERTISVYIVELSKHSAFLLQNQLHYEIQPASEDNMDILDDETIITEQLPNKMNSV